MKRSLPPIRTDLQRLRHRRAHGFSLVELMVVVGVIVIILVAGIASMTAAFSRSEEAQTRMFLAALQGIADEYRAATGVDLSNSTTITDLETFIEAARELDSCDRMLRALGPAGEIVIYDDGRVGDDASYDVRTLRDPWGNDVLYFQNSDGSVHPERESYFFVSEGSDGEEGNYNDGSPDEAHEDNIYSYEVD